MAYDASAFEARRRGLMDKYASIGSANTYGNFVSQQRGNRNLADMNKGFEKAQPQIITSFGKRGSFTPNVKTGAFQKALQDFAKERISTTSRAQQDLAQQNTMFNLGQAQLGDEYKVGLQDLEADKARQIEQDALEIMRLRSGF
jgi:hypothetical protein